jgi:hypothetical protein
MPPEPKLRNSQPQCRKSADISDVVAEENMASTLDKEKELKMPLRKIKILTFSTWVAKNFSKRINQS